MTSALGSSSSKKLPAWNRTRSDNPLLGHKLLECRLNLRKIETDPAEMRMRSRQSDRRHTLRGADIHETPVIVPAKLRGNRMRRARADSTHRGQEAVKDFRLRIHGSKEILAVLALVLMCRRCRMAWPCRETYRFRHCYDKHRLRVPTFSTRPAHPESPAPPADEVQFFCARPRGQQAQLRVR